jgi:hypothetical protein
LLFDPDANDEIVEITLMMFEPMSAATGDENATHYRVHIKNVKLFQLVLGCSFRLASRQIALVREELSLGYLNGLQAFPDLFELLRVRVFKRSASF